MDANADLAEVHFITTHELEIARCFMSPMFRMPSLTTHTNVLYTTMYPIHDKCTTINDISYDFSA